MTTRRTRLNFDALEVRAVPAARLDAHTLRYTEADGDVVTVAFSKPILTTDAIAAGVFAFDTGGVDGSAAPQQLQSITLAGRPTGAGTGVTVTVRRAAPVGDGFAAVGLLDASGLDLGQVIVRGDLGKVLAGDATTGTVGLRSLTVQSLGRYGTDTQAAGGDLASQVVGRLGALTVGSDFAAGSLDVTGGDAGSVGSARVGGAMNGSLVAAGRIGTTSIGGDVTGTVWAQGDAGTIRVGGSVLGGLVSVSGSVGSEMVGRDVVGGAADGTGQVYVAGSAGRVTIGGSVLGGAGFASGLVEIDHDAGVLTIGGDVAAGTGKRSAQADVFGKAGRIAVGGSLWGGPQEFSGSMFLATVGQFRVGGDFHGGDGPATGYVQFTGPVGSVSVGGSLVGGAGESTGFIAAYGGAGSITVGGDLAGGPGKGGATVWVLGNAGTVRVGGSVRGGAGQDSGKVSLIDNVRTLSVGGDVVGGSGPGSGGVEMGQRAGSVTVGGSVRGGSAPFAGQVSGFTVESMTIGGDVVGGEATADDQDLSSTGVVFPAEFVGRLTIGGSLVGATANGHTGVTLAGAGEIYSQAALGDILIRGDIDGRDGRARIYALASDFPGPHTDTVIRSLTVLGTVRNADILAGYDVGADGLPAPFNGDAQIGRVVVGGDWVASNLAAGLDLATGQAIPGARADIVSRIESVTVGGRLIGTAATGDTFLIAAQEVGRVTVAGAGRGPLMAGPSNDHLAGLGLYQDVAIDEPA